MELFRLVGEVALNGTDEVKNELGDISAQGESAETRLTSAFRKIGLAVATYFSVNKIINFGREISNVSANVAAENSAFAQIMGDFSEQARAKMQEVADATGVMSTRLTPYMTTLTAKFKGLGYDIDSATSLATIGLNMASDAAAFWDISLDDAMSHMNSFINGNYEGGEAIGLFANDTQMAAYAIRTGLIETKKEWANLDEATKQATRLEFAQAMMTASGAVGQAAKEAGQNANVTANLTEKWRQFKAEIGEPILQNVVLPIMEKMSLAIDKLREGYQNLKTWIEENKTTLQIIKGVVEAVTISFLGLKAGMMIQSVVQGFQKAKIAVSLLSMEVGNANLSQMALNGTMTIGETIVALLTGKMTLAELATGLWAKAQTGLNAVLSANPIGLVIAAIVAVIAIIAVLWNNCEGFRTFVIDMWEKLKEVINGIMNVISVAVQFIGAIFVLLIDIILIPWNFIWQNFGDTIMQWINVVKEWLNGILEFIKGIFESIWNNVKDVFNGIKTTITDVITNIKNVVGEIFNNIKDSVSERINAIKTIVTDVFNKIKTAITTPIEQARDTIKNVVNKIKEFFNFNVTLPKIKLPHFSITPAGWQMGDLLKGKVPRLGIEWYAKAMDKGMILDEPTIFGVNSNGIPMGGGEAGSETIVGTNSLMDMIDKAVKNNTKQVDNSGIEKKLDKIMDLMLKMKIELDDEEVGRFVVRTVEKEVFN